MTINRTFQTRKIFHAREVFAYYSFLIRLEVSRDNPEAAESYYNLLKELAPDQPELPELKNLIDLHTLQDMFSGVMDYLKKSEERRAKRKKRAPKPKKKGDLHQGDLFE